MTATEGRGTPAVSIVLPVHDTPVGFLREAVESVRAQTRSDWELIVVLDGASEACADAAEALAREDPVRIRVRGRRGGPPSGISAARNLGLREARAPLLGFLDADDVFEPMKLEEQLPFLLRHSDVDLVYCRTLYWHSWRADPNDRRRDFAPPLGVEAGVVLPGTRTLARFVSGRASVPCSCSVIVRTLVAREVGGFDESFPHLYEDQVFYARVALRHSLMAVDARWDRYRQHPESLTAQAGRTWEVSERRRFLEWLAGAVPGGGAEASSLAAVVRRELWNLDHPRMARVIRTVRRAVRRVRNPESRAGP